MTFNRRRLASRRVSSGMAYDPPIAHHGKPLRIVAGEAPASWRARWIRFRNWTISLEAPAPKTHQRRFLSQGGAICGRPQSTGGSASFSHSAAISLSTARDSGSVATFASCRQWVAKLTYRSRSSIDRSAIIPSGLDVRSAAKEFETSFLDDFADVEGFQQPPSSDIT